MHVRFSYPIAIPESAEAPAEFRIWKWGDNATLKGNVVLDEESAAEVVKAYSDHGVDLAIDYEHQTFNAEENGKPAPAAGWFTPQVRGDGLWATSVRWTDEAAAFLKARQYRYFSPVALVDSKTRKPARLMPMALTNWPATKNIEPLVARAETTSTEHTMKTVLLALGLKAEADEAEAFTAASKLRELEREIIRLSGKSTASEAMGALLALKSKAEQADALGTELATLKAEHVKAEMTTLLDEAVKDGRVKPAKRVELEQLQAKFGTEALRVTLSMLPKSAAPAIEPVVPTVESASVAGLTPEQQKILKLTGLSPEKFIEHKRAYAQLVNPTEEK